MKLLSRSLPNALRGFGLMALLALIACGRQEEINRQRAARNGPVIHEEHTDYSHLRVRERGRVRSLTFVEPLDVEVTQSRIDLDHPERLELAYSRYIFGSFLFRRPQNRVLIIGLGGGGMVRFLNVHFPETDVNVVEIDPAVVKVAADYFGVRSGENTHIITDDAFAYLARDTGRYDVLYMDAFLRPGEDTDAEGSPRRLKTLAFLQGLRSKLEPAGVVAFNLIENATTEEDLENIRDAFTTAYVFLVPKTRNIAVIATPEATERRSKERLRSDGAALDQLLDLEFSFAELIEAMD